jgi:putative aldouronate transport system substrate-binding protein
MVIFQKLEAKTGVHVEWEYTGSDWATQKPLLLASNDLPDFFFDRTVLNANDVVLNKELFVPLDDLIQKYGANIKAAFADDPNLEKFARAYDGKIYGLPKVNPGQPDTTTVWAINSDWIKKLNLKIPTTTEEFYTVLKAFKEKDPNGNGIADEIPLSGRYWVGNNQTIADIFCAFGIDPGWGHDYLGVSNGKVVFAALHPRFAEAIAYQHRLYAEGLMDQEIFTQENSQYYSKINPPTGSPEIVGVVPRWARSSGVGFDRLDH